MPERVKDQRGKSQVRKRGVRLDGRKTSVSLEDAFWNGLREIAAAQGTLMAQLIATIHSERRKRPHTNLSSAIRLFVLDHYRSRCGPEQLKPSGDPG
jgi:predicted DNA-binding ribbon-helix-helix protein